MTPDEKRHKEDLDESISDLIFVLGDLRKVKDIVQDGSTYSYGLPKRNTLVSNEVDSLILYIENQIKNAQKERKAEYGS